MMRNCPKCGDVADRIENAWACWRCNWIEKDEPTDVEPRGIELPQDVSDWLSSPAFCVSCGLVEPYIFAAGLITMDGSWCAACGGELTAYNEFQQTIEPLWRDLGGSN